MTQSNAIDLNRKVFLLVTGASRGIGQQMAIDCSKLFKSGSVILLFARSLTGLEETKRRINEANPNVSVLIKSIDLVHPPADELKKGITNALANNNLDTFDLAFVIHNVGTVGNVKTFARNMNDIGAWRDYYDANVFSVAVLNTIFIDLFSGVKKFIVNITSLAAIKEFPATAYYCSGKAAREMYFRVLAAEEADILVLNYSPGPVETDMFADLSENSASQEMRQTWIKLRETNGVLSTEQTTKKFLAVVASGAYKSGDHVDYFDELIV